MISPELNGAHMTGSHDGAGAADHDQPFTFGHHPTVAAPFPFSTRELARLLILRGQVRTNLSPLDWQSV